MTNAGSVPGEQPERDSTMRRRMVLAIVVAGLAGGLVGSLATLLGLWLWFGAVCTGGMTLVGQTPWRTVVPARPDASGRVYMLGYDDRYLLVLTSRSSTYPEAYYVDLGGRKIGLPNFGVDEYRRIPFLGCAFVDVDAYHGFPLDGALVADWKVTSDYKEVRIRITGFEQEEPGDSDAIMAEHMPIAYGNEIVLTRRRE